jgi:hypothetical protein
VDTDTLVAATRLGLNPRRTQGEGTTSGAKENTPFSTNCGSNYRGGGAALTTTLTQLVLQTALKLNAFCSADGSDSSRRNANRSRRRTRTVFLLSCDTP